MRTYVSMLMAAAVFFSITWLSMIHHNPGYWCESHPDDNSLYLCQPFDIEIKKGSWLERRPGDKIAGEDEAFHVLKTIKNQKKERKVYYNCEDPNVLLTKEGYDYCMEKAK